MFFKQRAADLADQRIQAGLITVSQFLNHYEFFSGPRLHRKSSRTPEQAHMPLLYTPYVPSLWEDFILRNRRILADQMEFLMAHIPKTSRLHA